MNNDQAKQGLFTSQRGNWKTPKALYQALDAESGFDHDPCPTHPKVDGLKSDWGNINFVNPPYGSEIKRWIQKGYQEFLKGKTVVFLLPSRTDTVWWHDYIMKATEIRFIRGRLKFDDQKNTAPFSSATAIFKPKYGKPNRQEK
jgi:hypothetical protein